MEVFVDQDTPPPRKRKKIKGDSPKPLFWFGRTSGVPDFGVGLLQPFSQATNPYSDSISMNLSAKDLSPGKTTTNQSVSDGSNGPHFQSLSPRNAGPHLITRFASEQANFAPIRTRQYRELGGSPSEKSATTKESMAFDSACNLLPPPRVHVRSSSAFPELNDIHVESTSAAAQFDKRRRVHCQPALYNGVEEVPHNTAPHNSAGGIRDRSQRPSEDYTSESSSERAPLLSRSRQFGSGLNASRSPKHQSLGVGTDDGVNETLQHIGKCKGLWLVAIAILVGLFLILFLYAFHIIQ